MTMMGTYNLSSDIFAATRKRTSSLLESSREAYFTDQSQGRRLLPSDLFGLDLLPETFPPSLAQGLAMIWNLIDYRSQ